MHTDTVLALLVASAVPALAAEVAYVPAGRVAEAFAAGRDLLHGPDYTVAASRRDAPGEVEIHARDTDVIYVVDGSATLVVGGTVADARTVSDGEQRAPRSDGGEARPLAKGDVVVVPAGTPHWFRSVQAPFLYYVVKVR